jgi:SWI2/SNF2 ATPase
MGGNWTFVLITDRQELDEQLANTFASVGALTRNIDQCQAQSRVHLRELLVGQERYIFMAVVVSQSQNEIDDLKQKGLDILPHRAPSPEPIDVRCQWSAPRLGLTIDDPWRPGPGHLWTAPLPAPDLSI